MAEDINKKMHKVKDEDSNNKFRHNPTKSIVKVFSL